MSQVENEIKKIELFRKLAQVCKYEISETEFEFAKRVSLLLREIDNWFDESSPRPTEVEKRKSAQTMINFLKLQISDTTNIPQCIMEQLELFYIEFFEFLSPEQKKYFLLLISDLFTTEEELSSTSLPKTYIKHRIRQAELIVNAMFQSRKLFFQPNSHEVSFLRIARYMMISANLSNSFVDKAQDLNRKQRPDHPTYTLELIVAIIVQGFKALELREDLFRLIHFTVKLGKEK